MERTCAVLLTLAASCYSPRLNEGTPCASTADCPFPQRCVLGSCAQRVPAIDAALPVDAAESEDAAAAAIDAAAVDAAPDAMPLPCMTSGLTCGGTATTFPCGGHCWARCTGSATWTAASQACMGWQGALGEIDDATEQSCVAGHVSTATWIGLRQSDAATRPADGWGWNGSTTPLVYMHWQEQCGKIQSDGTWDDVSCTATTPFLCERN
ncbi:MAG: C-type lectin domain-containing protein [Deltaproteobacteria bacterium]|nr:MAG: C-type lectin domain-containing protein [Deltaproteobacteria bacterium]